MAQTPHHAFTETISVVVHEFQIFLWGSSWSSTTNYALHYGLHVQIGKISHLVHFFAFRMGHIQFQCLSVPWICCKNGSILGFMVLEFCVGIHKMFSNPYGKHVFKSLWKTCEVLHQARAESKSFWTKEHVETLVHSVFKVFSLKKSKKWMGMSSLKILDQWRRICAKPLQPDVVWPW
jgi:hypothetical protein